MNLPLYPLKFKPILKEKVWGGAKLKTLLNKNTSLNFVGESWEISGVDDNISVVVNGTLAGKTITELIQQYQTHLMGAKVYCNFENKFPLLFKFIDAKQDLSVQIHPDDVMAKKRHNSFGKAEMWYILQADEGANLIIDFIKKIDKKTYLKHLKNETLEKILNKESIKKGEAFYITPGLIHAIGAGTLLAEIQQTSDITYRVYDWNRPDMDGSKRELHTDLALDAIDFSFSKQFKLSLADTDSEVLLNSPYFTVNSIDTERFKKRNLSKVDSFVVYMCVEGNTSVSVNDITVNLTIGETVLIPAKAQAVCFQKDSAKLLEVFIP